LNSVLNYIITQVFNESLIHKYVCIISVLIINHILGFISQCILCLQWSLFNNNDGLVCLEFDCWKVPETTLKPSVQIDTPNHFNLVVYYV